MPPGRTGPTLKRGHQDNGTAIGAQKQGITTRILLQKTKTKEGGHGKKPHRGQVRAR